MVRQAFFILLAFTVLAFWLQITWLYTALGLLLVALLAAQVLAKPARPPAQLVRAASAPRPPAQRPIIILQPPQPAHAGMGVFDVLLGTLMAHSVLASKGGPPSPYGGLSKDITSGYQKMDSRLESIEKKLSKSDDSD